MKSSEAIDRLNQHISAISLDDSPHDELLNWECVEIQRVIRKLEKELAELRENAIVPKFKKGQKVFRVGRYVDDLDDTETTYEVEENEVFRISGIKYYLTYGVDGAVDESEIFATREEAEASLKPEGAE